ncbi:MAG: cytochrome b/b6 domain-containing protein [Pseudomonadota bacterium]
MNIPADRRRTVLVWDFPVRLFHWALVLLLVIAWSTAQAGLDWMRYHLYAGYGILGLILFRLMWGVVGSFHARFAHFVAAPRSAWRYAADLARGRHQAYLGHNPLGGYMVLLLLALVLVQVMTGLFASDDILIEGPLAHTVAGRFSRLATAIHALNVNVLIAAAALHVGAIAYYRWRFGERLVTAMLTGRKTVASDEVPAQTGVSVWRALALSLLSAGLVAWIVTGF